MVKTPARRRAELEAHAPLALAAIENPIAGPSDDQRTPRRPARAPAFPATSTSSSSKSTANLNTPSTKSSRSLRSERSEASVRSARSDTIMKDVLISADNATRDEFERRRAEEEEKEEQQPQVFSPPPSARRRRNAGSVLSSTSRTPASRRLEMIADAAEPASPSAGRSGGQKAGFVARRSPTSLGTGEEGRMDAAVVEGVAKELTGLDLGEATPKAMLSLPRVSPLGDLSNFLTKPSTSPSTPLNAPNSSRRLLFPRPDHCTGITSPSDPSAPSTSPSIVGPSRFAMKDFATLVIPFITRDSSMEWEIVGRPSASNLRALTRCRFCNFSFSRLNVDQRFGHLTDAHTEYRWELLES